VAFRVFFSVNDVAFVALSVLPLWQFTHVCLVYNWLISWFAFDACMMGCTQLYIHSAATLLRMYSNIEIAFFDVASVV
jgi:hypothetical protein